MRELDQVLAFIAGIVLILFGIYLGEMNIKRIAIERGVAQINEAGEFEFKKGLAIWPCKPDGNC